MAFFFLVVLPAVSSVLITVAYPPQIIKNYRTKSVDDLSLVFWIIISTFCFSMVGNAGFLYFKMTGTAGYLITESINLAFALIILGQIIYYKHFYKGERQLSEVEVLQAIVEDSKSTIEHQSGIIENLNAIIKSQSEMIEDLTFDYETPEKAVIKKTLL